MSEEQNRKTTLLIYKCSLGTEKGTTKLIVLHTDTRLSYELWYLCSYQHTVVS